MDASRAPRSWRHARTPLGEDAVADIDEELRFHLELRIAEYIAQGTPPDEARQRALRRFGDVHDIRAETLLIDQRRQRRHTRADRMSALLQDLRFAVRAIRLAPGFASIVTLTLALGIGAATVMYSIVDGVLLRPLPYAEPQRLLALSDGQNSLSPNPASYPEFLDWKERSSTVFSEVGAWFQATAALTGEGPAETLLGERISANLPAMLGVQPLVGRGFAPDEEAGPGERVVMLSETFWHRRFAADSGVIGRSLTLNGLPHTVIGIFPSRGAARLPNELDSGRRTDYWAPLRLTTASAPRGLHFLYVVGRLHPGVAPAQAHASLRAMAAELRAEGLTTHDVQVRPLAARIVGGVGEPLAVLMAAVVMLLLIACANAANLLLARGATRQREFGVRMALGAGRARLVGQLLSESVLQALLGGLLGIALAWGGLWIVRNVLVVPLPRFEQVAIDTRILIFAVALSILTGLLFGIVPGLRAARADARHLLNDGGRGVFGNISRDRFRRALIVSEVALSFVLLVGAGLLLRSLGQLRSVPLGFAPERVLTTYVALPSSRYPDSLLQRRLFQNLLDSISVIPGVVGVALTSSLPVEGGTNGGVRIEGREFPPGQQPMAAKRVVSRGYLEVIGARPVAGRMFDARDVAGAPMSVIVNESFVRQYLGSGAIGTRVDFAWQTGGMQSIVGVIADVREGAPAEPVEPSIYIPLEQRSNEGMFLVVRNATNPTNLIATVRDRVRALDPDLPLGEVRTLDAVVRASVAGEAAASSILGTFAALALILAGVGLYGVISYSVVQRTQELGLRAALGARRPDLVRLVLRQGLGLVAIGLVLGAMASLGFGRLMASQLFGVGPRDGVTFAAVAAVLALVALAATALPALRATRADPLVALRQD